MEYHQLDNLVCDVSEGLRKVFSFKAHEESEKNQESGRKWGSEKDIENERMRVESRNLENGEIGVRRGTNVNEDRE